MSEAVVGSDWPVPQGFRDRADTPERARWLEGLPGVAAELAGRWGLTRDGAPMSGFLSTVWPVRDAAGRRLVLKVGWREPGTDGEVAALRAAPHGAMVELVADDADLGALLLQRLDPAHSLEDHPDVDEACGVIGDLVARVSSVPAPRGVRPMAEEVERITASIEEHRAGSGWLPTAVVDRAVATLADLHAELDGREGLPLVHGDCHFLNVLHTLPGEPPAWVAIDPLPVAGRPEWEVVAPLRNRWADALATGDPDRALRRRVDVLCEPAGMDRRLARAVAQAAAVDNLLWLLPRDPEHMFVAPYGVIAHWED